MKPRVITSREELIALARERRDEVNVSHLTIDAIAGWSDGYASKILAPVPIKNLGPMSFEYLLGALAMGIACVIVVEDAEQAARVSSRWKPRLKCSTARCVVGQNATVSNGIVRLERQKMAKVRTLGIRVDEDLDERLRAAAEKERRNVSDFARNLLIDALDKKPALQTEAAA